MVIHKYPIGAASQFDRLLPAGARVLSVQVQQGEPQMWVAVEPKNPPAPHRFYVVETGGLVPDAPFLGTIQLRNGSYVLHVFGGNPV